jgi:hypothetical protein
MTPTSNNVQLLPPATDWTDSDWNKFSQWLMGMLRIGPVTVTFKKKDGSERVMSCTTCPTLVPVVEEKVHVTNTDNPVDFPPAKKKRKINEDVMPVYDLEAKSWRSFIIKNVTNIKIDL